MLRDRYDPIDLFALVPQLGLQFEPQLAQLDRLLDDDEIVDRIRADLARRYPLTPVHGRRSTPVEVILRMLVVMRLYGWSYAQVEFFVTDSLVLRQFCRVYLEKVPDDTVLIRWANTIGPQTVQTLNDRVVQLARGLKVTRGRKLRVDTTAVETNIHYPTDSALLGDGVRVLSRLLKRAQAVLGKAAQALEPAAFRSRVRTVRRLAQQLHRIARRKGTEARAALKAAYGRLIDAAQRTGAQARRVLDALARRTKPAAQRLAQRIGTFLPLLIQGIQQASRRVLDGKAVPACEKVLSLFEPHTHPDHPPVQGRQAGRVRPQAAARRGRGRDHHGLPDPGPRWRSGPAPLEGQPGRAPAPLRPRPRSLDRRSRDGVGGERAAGAPSGCEADRLAVRRAGLTRPAAAGDGAVVSVRLSVPLRDRRAHPRPPA
jgi:transposase, IS5 family